MTKKTATGIFLTILLLAIGMRAVGLDRPFVLDEFKTIKFSRLPASELFEAIKRDSYPPLPYLVLSLWLGISGNEAWIRLLFVILGALSVILIYVIGKEIGGTKYAFLAMFIASVMPMQIWVSQYVRGIGLAIFFLLASTLFFLRLLKSENRWASNLNAYGYIVVSTMAMYSFYFTFFIIALQNAVYIFVNRRRIKYIFKWLILQLILIVSFLPWLGRFLAQMKEGNILMNFALSYDAGLRILGLPIGIYMRSLAGFLGLDQTFLANMPLTKIIGLKISMAAIPIFVVAITCFLWLLNIIYKKSTYEKSPDNGNFSTREALVYFSIFSVSPVILSVLLNILLKTPIVPRYFAVSSVFLVFVYAQAVSSLKNGRMLLLALLLLVVIGVTRLADFSSPVIDYKNPAIFLKNNIREDECLLFVGGENAYEYYAAFPKYYIGSKDYMRKYGIATGYSLEYLVDKDALWKCLRPFKIVWVYNSGETMSGIMEHVIGLLNQDEYRMIHEYRFKNISVFKYGKEI